MEKTPNTIDLRPLWDSILEIYKAYAGICQRHNLRFYLGYGSVLGAIRHKGFIPWDDDFDVVMPRPDYDRFWEIADKELPPQFKTVTLFNTKEYALPWGKIMETRKDVVDSVCEKVGYGLPQGIFIDIFPLDGCYTDPVRCTLRKLMSYLLLSRQRYLLNNGTSSIRSKLSRFGGFLLRPFFSGLNTARDFTLYSQNRLSKPTFDKSLYCSLFNEELGNGNDEPKMPRDVYGDPEWVPFEGLSVPVPHKWHEYLTIQYGDYMTLPPEEQRYVPTHSEQIVAPWRLGPTGV